MSWDDMSLKTSRRRLLILFGLGAAGTVAADSLFARLFARESTSVTLPEMVYDPHLQMMVDPATRKPVYARADMLANARADKDDDKEDKKKKKEEPKPKPKPLPTVTSSCDKCPKCDDNCG